MTTYMIDLSNPDHRYPWENESFADKRDYVCGSCRNCANGIHSKNRIIADGCPCNAPRGVNHGLVPKNTCTCVECDPAQTGSTRYAIPRSPRTTPPPAIYNSVKEFHLRGGVDCPTQIGFPAPDVVKLRIRLNAEEVTETNEALAARDMVEAADGIIDSVYVLVGNAIALGLSGDCFSDLWNEVSRSNLEKFAWDEGQQQWTVYKDSQGKVQKPPGWTPPDIAGVLKRHGWTGTGTGTGTGGETP